MRRLCSVFVVFTLSLIFSGCAGFANNNLGTIPENTPPPENEKKVKIYFDVDYKANMDMRSAKSFEDSRVGNFTDLIKKSNCCSMTTDENEADINLSLEIERYENPAALLAAFLTGFSLYTIPSWATYSYTYEATVIDRNKTKHRYEMKDSWTLVQWLPMIFAFPMNMPGDVDEKTLTNLDKHLVIKLREDKLL